VRENVEVGLCDTTGRGAPNAVGNLCRRLRERFGSPTQWAFHGHDAYGPGVANALAACKAGVATFDATFGGLGGCPFASGATGNTASEDLVYMFEGMSVPT
jgi:hydroxymethylglutaryl-CoA lyase